MADKIKKFFKGKKADAKFKKAGPGYKLDGSSSQATQAHKRDDVYVPIVRSGLTAESKQAAEAALARLGKPRPDTAAFNTSLAAIQAQVRREMEEEKKAEKRAEEASTNLVEQKLENLEVVASPLLAVSGVYFKCPLISPEVLKKEEWTDKIRTFLYEQLNEERGLTACLIIHSLNKNKEKVDACVDTLCKYLENIMQNPTEEKYRKIRMSNRIFQEKVAPIEGSRDFLEAAGFEIQKQLFQEKEEDFLVIPTEKVEEKCDSFEVLLDALRSAEPIPIELDRGLQVLLPSQAATRNELPPSFFTLSAEELKREQQLRSEAVERNMMLRTKAMREKEELREMKKYRFAIIRIRFPDGIMLQGTFGVYEKYGAILEFIKENISNDSLDFSLVSSTNQHLTEEDCDKSLLDLRLVPAAILNFRCLSDGVSLDMYLKPEIMIMVESF